MLLSISESFQEVSARSYVSTNLKTRVAAGLFLTFIVFVKRKRKPRLLKGYVHDKKTTKILSVSFMIRRSSHCIIHGRTNGFHKNEITDGRKKKWSPLSQISKINIFPRFAVIRASTVITSNKSKHN